MGALSGSSIVALAWVAAMPAVAQTTMFGIAMMQPIAIPECEIVGGVEGLRRSNQTLGAMASRVPVPYRGASAEPCYKRDNDHAISSDSPVNEWLTVSFPADRQPELANYDSVKVEVINGAVQRMEFATLGLVDQDKVIRALRAKFGPPQVLKPESRQNGFGAAFRSMTAFWTLPQTLTAFFDGAPSRTDRGEVKIQSAAAFRQTQDALRRASSGTPM